jgi:hypothetical protein
VLVRNRKWRNQLSAAILPATLKADAPAYQLLECKRHWALSVATYSCEKVFPRSIRDRSATRIRERFWS